MIIAAAGRCNLEVDRKHPVATYDTVATKIYVCAAMRECGE